MKTQLLLSLALGSGMILVFTGCNPTKSDSSTAAPPTSEAESSSHDQMDHDHADHDHEGESAGKTDMEKMAETLASFSDEDRQSAMKQHFCPVSGEMLGTMGEPEKVEVDGQNVWICCEACKDKLLAAPEKYLTKLSK
ncbi:MAG: hypothetical protein IT422_09935 [Pirellulaceae bacterium]|nr:hypothetical protein [Pirellulaceae bacterium]